MSDASRDNGVNLRGPSGRLAHDYQDAIEAGGRALADAEYWRTIVRNIPETVDGKCLCCGAKENTIQQVEGHVELVKHRDQCAWMAAHEDDPIDLNSRRRGFTGQYIPLYIASVDDGEVADVDLATIALGDWIEGLGSINEYAIIGFLHQCARAGLRLAPAHRITPKGLFPSDIG